MESKNVSLTFLLLLLSLTVFKFKGTRSEDHFIHPICKSPCQHPLSANSDVSLVPCVIKPSCLSSLSTVSADQAPAAVTDLNLESFPDTGPDRLVYLSITSKWNVSEERIEYLTGYEVSVICNKNPCVGRQFCFTMTFNRTLTREDASQLSVNCMYGNFSQPEMEYAILVKSLPHAHHSANQEVYHKTLPDCNTFSSVALCYVESPKTWSPQFRSYLVLGEENTISVSFWPMQNYKTYKIILCESSPGCRRYQEQVIDLNEQSPRVDFVNMTAGTYVAMVSIEDPLCNNDCTYFRSSNNVTVPVVLLPVPEITTLNPIKMVSPPDRDNTATFKPGKSESAGSSAPTPPLVMVASVLGGLLGVFLIVVLTYFTYSKKFRIVIHDRSSKGEKETFVDPTQGNNRHLSSDDCAFNRNSGIAADGQFRTFPSATDLYNDQSGFVCIDSPSLIPQTGDCDVKQVDRLLNESNYYANCFGYGKGDSISTAADIHPTANGHNPSKILQSSIAYDSGIGMTFSEITDDGESRILSLALTHIGEDV